MIHASSLLNVNLLYFFLYYIFFRRGEGLNKTAIGDYLGEKSPFHEQVLKAFVDLHDFTDLIIVQALRYTLNQRPVNMPRH